MRLTVLNQTAKGLPESVGEGEDQYELRPGVIKDLERIKWYLWHGNVFQALNELQSLEMDLDAAAFESKNENSQKLLKGIEELHTYVERNQEFVPNYGERYRNRKRSFPRCDNAPRSSARTPGCARHRCVIPQCLSTASESSRLCSRRPLRPNRFQGSAAHSTLERHCRATGTT